MFSRTESGNGSRSRGVRRFAVFLIVTMALGASPPLVHADDQASTVTWNDETVSIIQSGDRTRGATLATQCKACHGLSGESGAGLIPNLAGMNPRTIYKQLMDFQSDRRHWRDMTQIARLLSQQEMADLAAYWAAQPDVGAVLSETSAGAKLFNQGDDQNAIPACIGCHTSEPNEFGAPSLAGQQSAYIEHQLVAFAGGLRNNDIGKQMWDIASHLTPEERHAIAVYLSGVKP